MFKWNSVPAFRVTLVCAIFSGCSSGNSDTSPVPPDPLPEAVVQDGVTCTVERVKMRDGVELYTEIYRPSEGGKLPTVVIRNPYGKSYPGDCFGGLGGPAAAEWAKNGYSVAVQEVRGTSRSDGTFTPFLQEQNDGYDAIEWAAKQPWSNGKITTHIGSYLGVTQWQAALMSPPSLVAITPSVTPLDYRDDWVARNGVYDLQFGRNWGLGFVPDGIAHKMKQEGHSQSEINARIAEWQKLSSENSMWRSILPLTSTWDTTAKEFTPFIWDWYSHPNYDNYWEKIDVGRQMGNVKVPALISGGWYDLFARGTIDSYLTIKQSGGSQAAREDSMLVMDCCGHGSMSPDTSQITWGESKINIGQNSVAPLTLAWMNKYTKGDTAIDSQPKVQLTVLVPPDHGTQGDNFVYKTTEFPVPNTQYVTFALASNGDANTSSGGGILLENSTPVGLPDTFTYDPMNPVPSMGGNSVGQALDQSEVEKRNDVLVYTSAPLKDDKAVIGKISLRFWAASSAIDTDFTAKLVDVHPDGYAHNVVDNIVRAKYRLGSKLPPVDFPSNTPVEFNLDLGYTATLFKPGHRIRLEISSSNFPNYARNLNTGDSEGSSKFIVANQTIYHDSNMPSELVLPIVPGVSMD